MSKKSEYAIIIVMLSLGLFLFGYGIVSIHPTTLLGVVLLIGCISFMWFTQFLIKSKKETLSSYDYKTHGDFKKYYDTTQKRNYWVLGYFGGGSVNISEANKLAKEYANENNVPYDKVLIDEILRSRRYKYFKFIYAIEEQKPDADADCYEDVYNMLSD